jgi:hypothetical protein
VVRVTDFRDRTACMMRVKNESRWIRRSLERTWQVCARVVILDDGSTDKTAREAFATVPGAEGAAMPAMSLEFEIGGKASERRIMHSESCTVARSDDGARELHFLRSPFANAEVRPEERVHELRDKNFLWDFCRANIPFDHMLCLDGDEALSREALRTWPKIVTALDGGVDYVQLPFVYLWDAENQQRIDGIYGPAQNVETRACATCGTVDCESPRHKMLRFPRVFSIQRLAPRELFDTRFAWTGTRGGFHCGSCPQENFRPGGNPPVIAFAEAPVKHWGYLDEAMRQAKFKFYNAIDPDDVFEDGYKHVIGVPNRHAPGPVRLAPWEDV